MQDDLRTEQTNEQVNQRTIQLIPWSLKAVKRLNK